MSSISDKLDDKAILAVLAEDKKNQIPVPTYDPKKMYEWGHGSSFTLTGDEFGVILNSLRKILVTPEAQTILLADRASDVIEHVLARAVERGQVKEKEQKKSAP